MDSDQVFDHRKFDGGALQGGTAPTDTPRTDVWREAAWKAPNEYAALQLIDKIIDSHETLERELAAALAEVKRLNEWADGMTDAALKERQTGEMYQRELRAEIGRLRQQQDELARRVGEAVEIRRIDA